MKKQILVILACVIFATTACHKEETPVISTDIPEEPAVETIEIEETAEEIIEIEESTEESIETEEDTEDILATEAEKFVVAVEPGYQCEEKEFTPLPDVIVYTTLCTNHDDITSVTTSFTQPDGIEYLLEGTQISGTTYTLVITKKEDATFLELDAASYPSQNELVRYNDFNFDGFLDLQVQTANGTMNCDYDLYVYMPDTQTFYKANGETLTSSSIEPKEDGTLIVFGRSSASDYAIDTYVWDGYDLVLQSQME